MRRALLACLAFTAFAVPTLPLPGLAPPAYADDSGDARTAIGGQLDALRVDDGARAYSYAAPNIQRLFPSPEIFLAMVAKGYPAVHRSSNVTFGPLRSEGAGLRQEAFLSDADGQSWIASYTLERQPDGSLKITGCQMRKGNDIGA